MDTLSYTFKKHERLCRESHITKLFTGRNDFSAKEFPLRMAVNFVEAEEKGSIGCFVRGGGGNAVS